MRKRISKRETSWIFLLCAGGLLVLGGILTSCVQTGQTPEKAPAKTCVDCHPEMAARFKQGYIHAPVQEDRCDQCHRPHGLVAVIVLRQEEPGLCYACHQDLQPAPNQQAVHNPVAEGLCSKCHNPHNSSYPYLLNNTADETCFTCHARSSFSGRFIHVPLEKGCATCHVPHKSDNKSLLTMQADDLCLSCHQADKAPFKKAHMEYPVRGKCLQCHTPHAGNRPKLIKKNIHQPVDRGECDSCHNVSNNVIATRKPADILCLDCHDRPSDDRTSSHRPYLEEKCTACHLVHASDNSVLLVVAEQEICLTCHTPETTPDAAEETPAEGPETQRPAIHSIHQPVAEGRCTGCHSGHDSQQKFLLKTDPGILCFDCHDKNVFTDEKNSHPNDAEQSCAVCHLPHESLNKTLLVDKQVVLCFSCHRTQADERGRLSLHKPFAAGNCTGCHSLHKAEEQHYLKKAMQGGVLCGECHKNIQEADENIRPHKPVAQGECEKCHAAHSADYTFVIREKPGTLCLGCHKEVGSILRDSNVPHQPALQEDCNACHAAHGSPHEHILKKGQPLLCLSCHRETAQYWQDGQSHLPAVKNCLQCHSAHGSDQEGMLNTARVKLCGQCHQTTGEKFLNAHKNIRPAEDSCISCHDAHGGPDKGLLYPVGHTPFQEGTCKPCHSGRSE